MIGKIQEDWSDVMAQQQNSQLNVMDSQWLARVSV